MSKVSLPGNLFASIILEHLRTLKYELKFVDGVSAVLPSSLQSSIFKNQHTIVVGVHSKVDEFSFKLPTEGIFKIKRKGNVVSDKGWFKECEIKQFFCTSEDKDQLVQIVVCLYKEFDYVSEYISELREVSHSKGFSLGSPC